MGTENYAYPWCDSPGLCQVLRDSPLWASTLDFDEARRAAKRAGKKMFPKLGVLRVNDDAAFGDMLVALLVSPTGRKALAKQDLHRMMLSNCLHLTVHERFEEFLPAVIMEKERVEAGAPPGTNAQLFFEWLGNAPVIEGDEQRRALALWACCFAFREHAKLTRIASDFL